MDTRALMAIAGDVSPDVIYVNFRQSDTYIQEGFLYPLDEFVKRMSKEEWDERVPPQVKKVIYRWGPGKKTGKDLDKHYWALPYGTYIMGMVWRKDLFQVAGLDPEVPPDNWDEYYEFAKKCTDPKKGTFGIMMHKTAWSYYSVIVSAGARAMKDIGEDEWEATFNTPEAVTAYEYLAKLLQGKWRHPSGKIVEGVVYDETQNEVMWSQGRIAMRDMYFTDNLLADINPELIGIAPVPKGPDGKRASELNCTMCGIYVGAAKKGPEVLEAAWNFVHFLGSPQAKAERTRVLVENGYGMFADPVYLKKLGYIDYLRRIPKGWRRVFDEAMKNGEPEPYGRNCQNVYKYMTWPADEITVVENLGHREFDDVADARKRIVGERPDIPKAELEAELEKVRLKTRGEVRQRIKEILDKWVGAANQKMIGNVPPEEMAKRRIVAWIVAIGIAAAFICLFIHVWKVFKPVDARSGWLFRKNWVAYVILIPAVLTIGLWRYVPMIRGALIAFQDYHIVHISEWIGIDNFANVLWDHEFWQALGNSLWYAFLAIVMGFFTPIILAILLHEIPRGKILFRTLYYLPAVLSGLVVMLMWKNFFDPSPRGLLNQVVIGIQPWMVYVAGTLVLVGLAIAAGVNLKARRWVSGLLLLFMGIVVLLGVVTLLSSLPFGPKKWLRDPDWAMFCVILPTVWAGMGPGCLIYLAALKTIPEEIYEAADLDGAGFLGKVRHIALPSIKVLILINFIGAVVNAFRVSGYILAMTGGGPAGATEVLALKVFFDAFVYLGFGLATATAWILGAMLIGFTVFQLRRLSRVEFRTASK